MELSAELFKQTLAALKTDRYTAGKEKRSSPRVQLRSKIRILIGSRNNTISSAAVMLYDISQGGLCILHADKFEIETKYVVQLPGKQAGPLTMLCTVKNCRLIRNAGWAIGSTFTEVIAGTPETLLKSQMPDIEKAGLLSDQSDTYLKSRKIKELPHKELPLEEQPIDAELIKRIQSAMFD